VAQDGFGDAPEQQPIEAPPSVRSHYDEVSLPFGRAVDDPSAWIPLRRRGGRLETGLRQPVCDLPDQLLGLLEASIATCQQICSHVAPCANMYDEGMSLTQSTALKTRTSASAGRNCVMTALTAASE
jgi:hypothetical protein